MELVVLLIGLAMQRYVPQLNSFCRFEWFACYLKKAQEWVDLGRFSRGPLGLALFGLPVLLIVCLCTYILHYTAGLAYLLWSIFVLVYCFGTANIYQLVQTYFTLNDGGEEAASTQALENLIGASFKGDDVARAVTHAIFLRFHKVLFAVMFWFVLLGPVGAVLYRLTDEWYRLAETGEANGEAFHASITGLRNILDWLPIRLSVLLYGLVGHISQKFTKNFLNCKLSANETVLVDGALMALQPDEEMAAGHDLDENKGAFALVGRMLALFLVLIAIFTLGAWIY